MKDSIKALRELEKRLYAYQYAMAVADYDSETVAPPESSAGRAHVWTSGRNVLRSIQGLLERQHRYDHI